MIDCSHANSNKDYTRQAVVCRDVAAQIAAGNRNIIGVMIESNLVAGAQKLVPGHPLVYGQSITDALHRLERNERIARGISRLRSQRPQLIRHDFVVPHLASR